MVELMGAIMERLLKAIEAMIPYLLILKLALRV